MPGNLILQPSEACLIHYSSPVTKVDPYCVFEVGGHKFTTQVCTKGGKHPYWNDILTIPVTNESQLKIEVLDDDCISDDKVMGSLTLNVQELKFEQHVNRWYPLVYKDQPAGEIQLEIHYKGDEQETSSSKSSEFRTSVKNEGTSLMDKVMDT